MRAGGPVVGIVAHPLEVVEPEGASPHLAADSRYPEAVWRAGGVPVILPIVPEAAAAVIEGVDAVVLTGGEDVDPGLYGHPPGPRTRPAPPSRDASEMAACRAALEIGRPLLAVCRGMQVLNVALGGTLVQDVEGHYVPEAQDRAVHGVYFEPGSRLADWMGLGPGTMGPVGVNSLHHQVLDRLGEGLVVLARAEDGTAEAVGLSGRPEVLGVQWHPELLGHLEAHLGLFRHLVALAGDRPQVPGG